jgi:hypothetical protein
MNKIVLAAVLTTAMLFTLGCNQEQDDLGKAQSCLDNVPESDPTQADSCLQFVEKYDSQQAQILKCSIYMTSGGLVEAKVVAAYKALKNSTLTNKSAAYMAALSLDLPTVAAAYDKAVLADTYCQATGVPGLAYLSSLIKTGTAFNLTITSLPGSTGPIDITDPASVDTAVTNLLNLCAPAGGGALDPACDDKRPAIGQATLDLETQYCANSSADQNVCASINSAVQAAGGDPDHVGQALFCYLGGHGYTPATNLCQ